jgi:hypothetical protein
METSGNMALSRIAEVAATGGQLHLGRAFDPFGAHAGSGAGFLRSDIKVRWVAAMWPANPSRRSKRLIGLWRRTTVGMAFRLISGPSK